MALRRKRILIAFHWYLESLHAGVLRYCVENGWESTVLHGENVTTIGAGTFDGIIGMLPPESHPVNRFASDAGVPVVELSQSYPSNIYWGRYPSDGLAVGKLAAEHLRRRPVASFAFIHTGEAPSHELRRTGFIKAMTGDPRPIVSFDTTSIGFDGTTRLTAFLSRLPRPIGIFGSVDTSAHQALQAAQAAGLHIPEDAYILGFGNRQLLSALAPVPISSISIDHEAWGYAAAGLLDEMMSHRAAPGTVRTFAPGAVIERTSTGAESGAGHPLCSRAITLMHEHAARPLGVAALAKRLGVSKATLERAFAAAYGVGVAKKYLHLRLEIAKSHLIAGEKTAAAAAAAGFASYRAFGTAFTKATGLSPSQFGKR